MVLKPNFNKISDFLNYFEFCPLCNSRTSIYVVPSAYAETVYFVDGSKILIPLPNHAYGETIIDIFTSQVWANGFPFSQQSDKIKIQLGQQCKKYHFSYTGKISIDYKNSLVSPEMHLFKIQFLKIIEDNSFYVNLNFEEENTNVKITGKNYLTKEVSCGLIDFDFKKINKTLKKILLLI